MYNIVDVFKIPYCTVRYVLSLPVLHNVVILVPSSTLGIWGFVNWGFGALGIWDNGLLGELDYGSQGTEKKGK
jgi:hypothetical protein